MVQLHNIILYCIIIYTDDDNHIVLKPTDSFIGAAFLNACYIDVSIVMYTNKNVVLNSCYHNNIIIM